MMFIGKIVKSYSHINYGCQIYGPGEVEMEPGPADYAFARFVRVALRTVLPFDLEAKRRTTHDKNNQPASYAVGIIYNTTLLNPTFGSLGPRLSNEAQVEIFSPDYLSEKGVLVYIMVLGTVEQHKLSSGEAKILVAQGVPLPALELGSEVEVMTDEEVRTFHLFSDEEEADSGTEYLHMGYLPRLIAQRDRLIPMVILRIIDQLERLFPQNLTLLSILKRNFAWRLKIESTG